VKFGEEESTNYVSKDNNYEGNWYDIQRTIRYDLYPFSYSHHHGWKW
jgi:hypothetical protein